MEENFKVKIVLKSVFFGLKLLSSFIFELIKQFHSFLNPNISHTSNSEIYGSSTKYDKIPKTYLIAEIKALSKGVKRVNNGHSYKFNKRIFIFLFIVLILCLYL